MTVGTGIFLSAVLLAAVLLFNNTKDRWQWKRITAFAIGGPAAAVMLTAAWIYGSEEWEKRLRPVSSFIDVSLGASPADVRFSRGQPTQVEETDSWVYVEPVGYGNSAAPLVLVRFRDGKVRFVLYTAPADQSFPPDLLGFSIGSRYEDVVDRLGVPSHIDSKDDGLSRVISYEKLNTFFEFTQGKVSALGIYQPKDGPMEFRKPKADSKEAPQ